MLVTEKVASHQFVLARCLSKDGPWSGAADCFTPEVVLNFALHCATNASMAPLNDSSHNGTSKTLSHMRQSFVGHASGGRPKGRGSQRDVSVPFVFAMEAS